jgi:hypothetical protein
MMYPGVQYIAHDFRAALILPEPSTVVTIVIVWDRTKLTSTQ